MERALTWEPTTRHVWYAFAGVHLWIAFCGVVWLPNLVFWDLTLYRAWMWWGTNLGTWPVLDQAWVYPAGALVPLLAVAELFGYDDTTFALGWTVLVTALNALAVAMVLRRRRGTVAAMWWMVFLFALGPVAIGRLDAFVAPLAIMGLLALKDRPRVAAVLLTIGAWIKVAPGALMLPVVLASKKPLRWAVLPALAVSAVVVGVVGALGGLHYVTSFLFTQGGRGMQLEAVGASPWLLWGLFSRSVTRVLNTDIYTWEVHGPGVQVATSMLDAAFFVGMIAVTGVLVRRRLRERRPQPFGELVVGGSMLVLLTMIVTNKVLSPQYITWLAAPVVVALATRLPGWRRPAVAMLAIAGATQLVFPWFYNLVIYAWPVPTLILVGRNVALIWLWVHTLRSLWADPAPERLDGAADREDALVGAAAPAV